MPRTFYTLLWVMPVPDREDVPPLEQLDEDLGRLYAHVMYGTSMERKVIGHTAIRLFGAADESAVLSRLRELHYTVVGSETRSSPVLL